MHIHQVKNQLRTAVTTLGSEQFERLISILQLVVKHIKKLDYEKACNYISDIFDKNILILFTRINILKSANIALALVLKIAENPKETYKQFKNVPDAKKELINRFNSFIVELQAIIPQLIPAEQIIARPKFKPLYVR